MTALRIGVDAEFLAIREPDGIPRSSFWLIQEMAMQQPSIRWILFTPAIKWMEAATALSRLPNCEILLTAGPQGRLGRIGWRVTSLPRLARRLQIDLLFNPAGNGPLWMPREIPLVATVHDAGWLAARGDPILHRLGRRLLVGRTVNLSSRVLTVSASSAQEIKLGLRTPTRKVIVIHNGLDPTIAAKSLYPRGMDLDAAPSTLTATPFGLFVGSGSRRKNLARVRRAFGQLKDEMPGVTLAVVGAMTRRGRSGSSEGAVRYLGYVDEATLRDLYRRASFLIFPSLYEGFGLPIIEAMALGAPVITSSVSAMAEVAGEASLLVDPYDEDQILTAMRRLFLDTDLRAELRQRGFERAREFTWERSARLAFGALSGAVGDNVGAGPVAAHP